MHETIRYERLDNTCPPRLFRQLALVHKDVIDQGFLSTLGTGFLQRLYRGLASSPHAFVIAAFSSDEIVGFICGSTDTGKVYRRFLLRHGLVAILLLLPKVLSLHTLRRVMETLFYPARRDKPDLPSAELLNLCVALPWQRKGVGRELFLALVDEFRSRNVAAIKIVTGANQHQAHQFYESLHATKADEIEIHGGVCSYVYVYAIPLSECAESTRLTGEVGTSILE